MNDIVFPKKSKNANEWYFKERLDELIHDLRNKSVDEEQYEWYIDNLREDVNISWHVMKDNERAKYEHLAKYDKERYEREVIELKIKYPLYESYKEEIKKEIEIKSKEMEMKSKEIDSIESEIRSLKEKLNIL